MKINLPYPTYSETHDDADAAPGGGTITAPVLGFNGQLGTDWNDVVIAEPENVLEASNWTEQGVNSTAPFPTKSDLATIGTNNGEQQFQVVIAKAPDARTEEGIAGEAFDEADSLGIAIGSSLTIESNGLKLYGDSAVGGVALTNNGGVNIDAGFLEIDGGSGTTIDNAGQIVIDGSQSGLATLKLNGTVTLTGTGTVVMSSLPNGGVNQIVESEQNSFGILLNESNISGEGRIGQKDDAGGDPSDPLLELQNTVLGVINATADVGQGFFIDVPTAKAAHGVINEGMIEATGLAGLTIEHSTVLNVGNGISGTLGAFGTGQALGDYALTLLDDIVEGGNIATDGTGAVEFTNNGTLDGSTDGAVTNTGNLVIETGTEVLVFGSIVNQGTITEQPNNHPAVLEVGAGGLTLSGAGQIHLHNTGADAVMAGFSTTSATTLDNVDNTIIGSGYIDAAGSEDDPNSLLDLTNGTSGTVNADDASQSLVLAADTINFGRLEATGAGGLTIGDPSNPNMRVDQSGGGTIAAFGTIGVNGVTGSAGGLAHVDLQNVTVLGGTLTTNGLGVINVTGQTLTTLDGSAGAVTNAGLLVDNSFPLLLNGTIVNTGTIATNPGIIEIGESNVTLTGGGLIALNVGSGSAQGVELTGSVGGAATTLINVNNTIAGVGWIGGNDPSQGTTFPLDIDNQGGGVINSTATNPSYQMTLGNVFVTNEGLIEDTGIGGLAITSAIIAQTVSGTILAAGAGTHIDLTNSTIAGGTLNTSGGGVIDAVQATNTLDGSINTVTNAGSFVETAGASTQLLGTIVNTGTIGLDQSQLTIQGDVTLLGGGTVAMTFGQGESNTDDIGGSSATAQATLHNIETIAGAGFFGQVQGANATNFLFALDNRLGGTIDASVTSGSLTLNTGQTVANAGVIEATSGGSLVIDDPLNNSGTLAANGGSVDAVGALSGAGSVIIEGGGTLDLETNFSQNVSFQGPGTLVLPTAPNGYNGTITGLAAGDTIDIPTVSFSANFQAFAASTQTANELFIIDTTTGNPAASLRIPLGDVAGNFAISADQQQHVLLTFTDTNAIPQPPTLALSAASDSAVQGDDITNVANPVITGNGTPGDRVTLFAAGLNLNTLVAVGAATVANDGTWSANINAPLVQGGTDGTVSLTAYQTNGAGSVSAASTPLALQILTATPTPSNPVLSAGSDSGTMGDNTTDIATPFITGTGRAGDTVSLADNGTPVGSGTVGNDGTWSIQTSALAVGTHDLFATETDPAGNVGTASDPLQLTIVAPSGPTQSPAVLNDFGWAQGWGSVDNPRMLADVNQDGNVDYLGFGFNAVFVAYGGTFGDGQGHNGPGFAPAVAAVNDFGTNEGYTADVQRGAADAGVGSGDILYGQGFAGVFWYQATGATQQMDAAGNAYQQLQYQTAPNFYQNFGSQEGWSPANGFQILKTTHTDATASILGFGDGGIVVGPQAFAAGATANDSYVLDFQGGASATTNAGNNFGWDQQNDIRTFTDAGGQTIDLNHDGIADFVGMGPNGLEFAFGNNSGPNGGYGLGALTQANIGGVDLGDDQGWNNASTLRYIVADPTSGFDDIVAFGYAGVYLALGQDPAANGGQPFGQLNLVVNDFGTAQGWSVDQTPRIATGDVNGDGIPDIVGFGFSNTFVAASSRDAGGHVHWTFDPNLTIPDFGSSQGWSSASPNLTVRALGQFGGPSGHADLVLSGAFNTQVWQFV